MEGPITCRGVILRELSRPDRHNRQVDTGAGHQELTSLVKEPWLPGIWDPGEQEWRDGLFC
jgi:hypothetical protein